MEARLARFRRYLRRLRDLHVRLRQYTLVHHLDVGYRYTDGARREQLAIRLFVAGPKRPKSQAKGHRLAPARIEGIPLDVISFAPVKHAGGTGSGVVRPLIGGICIGSRTGGSVTLGAVVVSATYPGLQALTSDEVGRAGDSVSQPCVGLPGAEPIGTVNPPSFHNSSALVSLGSTPASRDAVRSLPSLRAIVESSALDALCVAGAAVEKMGAATDRTTGVLDGREAMSGSVSIVSDSGDVLADRGDCGAIWMTTDGQAVALHYAGQDARVLAQAMHHIRDVFGLVIP
jgi:hypothetical protein